MKYVGKGGTHTPGTLHTIPSEVLNRLAKLTSQNLDLNSKQVDSVYPYHDNTLRKAGLVPSNFLKIGELWNDQDEKVDRDK